MFDSHLHLLRVDYWIKGIAKMDLYHHQLIVLGNGFDFALGLNTGYADYFNSNYGECPQMDHMKNAWDMVMLDQKLHKHEDCANVERSIAVQLTNAEYR